MPRAISRQRLFAFTYLLLALNGLFSLAVIADGWLVSAANLFEISAIVWLALVAGLALLLQSDQATQLRRGDTVVASLAVLAALVPVSAASSAMLTLAALWGHWTSERGSAMKRASTIFLSITAFTLWGRVGLVLGAGPLLRADASYVALLSGMQSNGNTVEFVDGTHFLIAPGCSSLHGVSLALILWTTVVEYFAVRRDARVWLTLALAVLLSVLVNGLRLTIIAWHPHDFEYWHLGMGASLFGWIALVVVAAVIYLGVGNARRMA